MDSILVHTESPNRGRLRALYGLHFAIGSLWLCVTFFANDVPALSHRNEGIANAIFQSAIWWLLTQRFLKFNRGWAVATVHSGLILLLAIVTTVGMTVALHDWRRWLVLAAGTGVVAFGFVVSYKLSEEWDRATRSKREELLMKLNEARKNGGTCPKCAGTGVVPLAVLDRAFIALGAGMSSLGGQPVSSRTAVREFESKCSICGGAGRFVPQEPLHE